MELPGYDELKKQCLEAAPEGVDTREGSLFDTAVGPVCAELAAAYLTLQSFYDLLFPDTSAGAYLDRIAAQYGISRGTASPAVLEAEFTDQAFAAVEGDSAWIKRAASASLCKLALQSRMQAKKMMKLLGPLQKSEKPEMAAAAREIKNEIEYSL